MAKNARPVLVAFLQLLSNSSGIQNFIVPAVDESPDPAGHPNLLCNPSLEAGGQGSLQCWHLVKDFVTFTDTFDTTVPAGGGSFSVRVDGYRDASWDPDVETFVTILAGGKALTLSAGGQVIELWLKHIRSGTVIDSTVDAHFAFSDWRHFSVTDTLVLLPQDSLQIKLIQNTGQNSACLVDLVRLTAN